MKVKDVVEKLNLTVFGGEAGLDREIKGGYVSDLLSDVMGSTDEGTLWVTLQSHRNVVGIAALKDLAGVIIVKGFVPNTETLEDSDREGVPLLGTSMETFEVAGLLYRMLADDAELPG
ncbi:DRTGG domain-containing protein [Desulfoluna sp.]|uniref:DRTGG domain-containing protein n=1 Tax=Desulfoluna sp. TaxID=2045199 RepID=UPI00262423E4|nr:DRTGG domain-containing protein [Desulfoluna sp.]